MAPTNTADRQVAPRPVVGPDVLEREIRTGAPVVIVDVRTPDAFEHWQLDPGTVPMLNIPLGEIAADPDAALARLGGGRVPIRVMCARGRAASIATDHLVGAGAPAATIEGGMQSWSQLLTADDVPLLCETRVVQLRREARGCLSYVVASEGQALVVDPGLDVNAYVEVARGLDAAITSILDSHVHADHLSGMWRLAELTGARRYVSTGARARGADPEATLVSDGDLLAVGTARLQVLALPGHTSDNVGLVVDAVALIAGDSLFADAIARPDLESGDAGAADSARVLWRTLHEQVLALPPETRLLPCHYAGGRRTGPVAPTLGEVRAAVPMLGLDEDAFVRELIAQMPPRPENYEQIIAVNLACGRDEESEALEVGGNNCAAGPSS